MNKAPSRLLIHSLEAHRLGDGLDGGLGPETLRMLSRRAILLSRPGDAVIVDSDPDEEWIAFLRDIETQIGQIRVARGSGDTITERIRSDKPLMEELSGQQWVIEPYMGGDEIEGLATQLQSKLHAPSAELLNRLNLKSNLESILIEVGLPTIPTVAVKRDGVLKATRSLMNTHDSVIVRSDLSIGGHGVWIVKQGSDLDMLATGIARSGADRLFVLQPLYSVANSPNVQFEITGNRAEMLGISDQQMTQSFAFGGNQFPSVHSQNAELLDQSDRIARWLKDAGYCGVIGIDFIVTNDGKVYIVEVNPRVNTSTFPLLLSRRLGCEAFQLMTGIQTGLVGFASFAELIGAEILYDKDRGSGVVPLMAPKASRPIIDAMVFGDDLECVERLSQNFIARLQKSELIGGGS